MQIDRLDHIVLTVRDIEATCAFGNLMKYQMMLIKTSSILRI